MTTTSRRTEVNRRQGWSSWLGSFFTSDIGMKWLMALTGIGLLAYVLVHMIGNLKVYFGAEEIDTYAEGLRGLLYPIAPKESVLWIFRLGLIAAFVIHIWTAVVLTRHNQIARGRTRYTAKRQYLAANYAARTMRWSGTIVLLFVLYHLADLTLGWVNPDFVSGAVYANILASFEVWYVALFYVVAQIFLAIHIFHGAWSLFQSLGLANRRYNEWRRWFAVGFALVILIGNSSIPIAVQLGVIS